MLGFVCMFTGNVIDFVQSGRGLQTTGGKIRKKAWFGVLRGWGLFQRAQPEDFQ